MHSLCIIFTRTHTVVGSLIRKVLGGRYNHCSIVLDDDFSRLYSFSRYYTKFWFTGCFCVETIGKLSFGKECIQGAIAEIQITDREYKGICKFLSGMSHGIHVYNYINACLIPFRLSIDSNKSYICSTFVAKILSYIDEVTLDKKFSLYKPMELYDLLKDNIIFEGNLYDCIRGRSVM